MARAARWAEPADVLDRESLRRLMAGEIPAIHLAGFASAEECERFRRAVHSGAVPGRAAATSPMTVFGGNLSNFRGAGRDEYFAGVEQSYRDVEHLYASSFDPLERIVARLDQAWARLKQ